MPQDPAPSPWRPIETAPKDGSPIWLGIGYTIALGWWDGHRWHIVPISPTAGRFAPTHWASVALPAPPDAFVQLTRTVA